MRKNLKIILAVFIVLAVLFSAAACSSGSDYYDAEKSSNGSSGINSDISKSAESAYADEPIPDPSERIIIYTAEAYVVVKDVTAAAEQIQNLLQGNEWISSSKQTDGYATYVIRVKTERLDAFLQALKGVGNLSDLTRDSEDVTVNYYDNTAKKTSLINEQTRLNELLTVADNMTDILTITKRLAEIDTELAVINRTLNNYDSLVEYSTVTVYLRPEFKYESNDGFFARLKDAYAEGWEVAKDIIIFLLAALPFLVVIAGIVVGSVYLKKAIVKKKNDKKVLNNIKLPEEDKKENE